MKKPVVLIGIGEMGGVFARGFLRTGHPVIPVTRDIDMQALAVEIPDPELVMVAVAESDLHAVLKQIPSAWQDHIGLLQNELLPQEWQQHHLHNPSVISVWFEKKKGQDARVIIPSPVYGPKAQLIHDALVSIAIPCTILESEAALLHELVLKNIYILTTNLAGLETGGTVGELWEQHQPLAREIANEVADIQEWLTGTTLPRAELIKGMVHAFQGDLAHRCMGRSAPARLQRAIQLADSAGLEIPKIRALQAIKSAS